MINGNMKFPRYIIAATIFVTASQSVDSATPHEQFECERLLQLQASAEHDDAEAQFALSKLYFNGICVSADPREGARWLNEAAARGYSKAQGFLAAALHREGQDNDAAEMARLAAEQGDAQGQYVLSFLLASGLGIPEDDGEAVKWAKRAATQCYSPGQIQLGNMYQKGRGGLPKDAIEADKWYILAGKSNADNSWLAALISVTEARMTREAIREAQFLADTWDVQSCDGNMKR